MPNRDKPNGFRPINSTLRQDRLITCAVNSAYATPLAVGMFVKSAGTLNTESGTQAKNIRNGLLEVVALAAGDTTAVGLITAVHPNPDNLKVTHIPASVGGVVTVYTDFSAVFVAQEDSDGGSIAATAAGQFVDLIDAGVSATGVAQMELDSSTVGATGQFRLERLYKGAVNNELGTNAQWLVTYAEHRDITDAVAD